MVGDKLTDEIRFTIDGPTLARLKRVAEARGFMHHGALARQWVVEKLEAEIHAAKVILGQDDGHGTGRNPLESTGAGRK